MTTKRKAATGKGGGKKLKLKKETLKDLEVKGNAKRIKGGQSAAPTCACTGAFTNCKVSCVVVCGGGGGLIAR